MTGLLIAAAAIGMFILSGYFLTKREKAVFLHNLQNGNANRVYD